MAYCFLCGQHILDGSRRMRRKVKTGEHFRRRYSPNRLEATQASFGMRIVCKRCATFLDRKSFFDELKREAWLLIVLLILAILFVFPHIFG